MALNKDVLGTALYNVRQAWNNKSYDDLLTEHGTMEAARLAMCKAEADVIITHFKTNADGVYQPGSLIAGANAVTNVGVVVAIKIN